ncbi:MAG TPA: hypothetical protein DEV75_11515 [Desulfovibrio sp.]|nr:hypothetical protein [Desulfovibrio sp.]
MVAASLDSKLLKIAKRYGMVYTRYADDITFSHVRDIPSDCIACIDGVWRGSIIDAVVASGFRPNQAKIKLSRRGNRQEVTGVIANEKLNVRRDYIDKTRCALTAWEKYGFEGANKVFHEKYPGKRCGVDVFIAGRLAHIGNVRGKGDYLFCKLMRRYAQLAGLEYECQISSLESINSSLFLLLDSDGLECGTAFLLKGYGLVTCAHVADVAMHCVHWEKRDKKYFLEVVKKNDVADVAILKPVGLNCKRHYWLNIAEDLHPASHAVCSFSGFPNPNGIDGPSHYACTVVSYTVREGIEHFKISQIVIGGASGSPLLNAQKNVIGIVVRGLGGDGPDAGNVDNNLAVNIKYIKE